MNQFPLIGLTSARMLNQGAFLTGMPKTFVNTDYTDAVSRAGGLPILLPAVSRQDEIEMFARLCDGILVTGGKDVAPLLYGEMTHPQCGEYDLEVDRCHIALIRAAVQAGKPVLGICRGLQLINVALGGTLYQDLPAQMPGAGGHLFSFIRSDAVHTVSIAEDSPLYRIFGKTTLEVNSIHHQALKDPGKGVVICAASPDGVAEAFTVPGKNILAVQWHPEMLLQRDDDSLCLFEAFIKLCRKN